ncbi:MAG: phosphatase PAP2 family protein [Caldilineaceae bacterium]|nr:phosphatase PAP2 family protein [Caldilineaceae bacterium]
MDLVLLNFFNQTLANPVLDVLMLALSTVALGVIPVLIAGAFQRGRPQLGKALIAATIAAALFTALFYGLSMRPRPPLLYPVRLTIPPPAYASFPSGHTSLVFANAVVMALYLRRRRWWILGLGWAASVGVSRLYLGHHFPSDVFAGAVMGAALGAAAYGWFCTDAEPVRRLRWLLWPQVALAVVVTEMAYLGILPLHLLAWPNSDKVLHFLLIGSVAFWLNLWWEGRRIPVTARLAVPLALVAPFAVALTEEAFQALSPLRTASLVDLSADLLGLIVFWYLAERVLRHTARFPQSTASPPA